MTHPRHWSLGTKLPLTLALVVVAVSLTIGLVMVAQERSRIRADLEQRAMRETYSVAANAATATLRADYWALFKILAQVSRGSASDARQVISGVVIDRDGVVMAALDPAAFPVGRHLAMADPAEHERLHALIEARKPQISWGGDGVTAFVEAVHPIEANRNFTGLVLLRLSAAEIATRTWLASLTILGITATLAAVGSVIGAYISNRMIRPLRELAGAMESVGREESGQVPQVLIHDYDEIGRLVQSFQDMARDLAEKRSLERELATAEKLAALGGIAAGVAHEINNPLAGMLNCIDTLEKYPGNEALVHRYLPLIKKGLHRIHSIVRGLLAELRVEDDGHWGSGECLDDIRELVLAETEGRNIRLEWNNGLGCESHLKCRHIQQVVFNLLKNAVQAVGENGQVRFRAFTEERDLIFEVEDNGVGIPSENMSRLFDPFFTSKPAGTGLGLWITYRIVQSMGGVVEVESEAGLGSLFRIRVPNNYLAPERLDHDQRTVRIG